MKKWLKKLAAYWITNCYHQSSNITFNYQIELKVWLHLIVSINQSKKVVTTRPPQHTKPPLQSWTQSSLTGRLSTYGPLHINLHQTRASVRPTCVTPCSVNVSWSHSGPTWTFSLQRTSTDINPRHTWLNNITVTALKQ